MKQLTLKQKAVAMVESLPSSKVKRVIEYLEYLQGDYDTFDVNEKVKGAIYEVGLMREGKIKSKTLKEFLGEL